MLQHQITSTGIGINALNPRGLGTESPESFPPHRSQLFRRFRSLAHSALSSDSCLRSQLPHEPIPPIGCRNQFSASRARPTPRLPVRRRKSLPRALWLAINLLPGEYPPGRFGQVARHRDHLSSAKIRSSIMRPPFPSGIRDASRREPFFTPRGNPRAGCVYEPWPEP